jgi:hypothetical protein
MLVVMRAHHDSLRNVALSRRIVNSCLLLWLATRAFRIPEGLFAALLLLALIAVSLFGAFRLISQFVETRRSKVLFTLGIFVPVVHLLVMGVLSQRAAKVLSAAGYRVGMFEAKAPNAA